MQVVQVVQGGLREDWLQTKTPQPVRGLGRMLCGGRHGRREHDKSITVIGFGMKSGLLGDPLHPPSLVVPTTSDFLEPDNHHPSVRAER